MNEGCCDSEIENGTGGGQAYRALGFKEAETLHPSPRAKPSTLSFNPFTHRWGFCGSQYCDRFGVYYDWVLLLHVVSILGSLRG